MNKKGLIRYTSKYKFNETIDRIIQSIKDKNIEILARIDHGLSARTAGLDLTDATVLIFGNSRGGTPLMAANPELGIDLPLRILVWVDDKGVTQTTYNAPTWIAHRHGLDQSQDSVTRKLTLTLEEITQSIRS